MIKAETQPLLSNPGRKEQVSAQTTTLHVPLLRPAPPRLSEQLDELRMLEDSGVYTNYGPVNSLLEQEFLQTIFKSGSCVTVCNATIGLMLAMREVIGDRATSKRRYALMPSFTFVAAAQAAIWCGLTPLFCDIDPETWMAEERQEHELLQRYAGQIAVVVPYATFGNTLDLKRYHHLSLKHDVPVVVDAAASLGSLERNGEAFGAGCPWPIVFSMHATKVFSVSEGGLIYSADEARIERLRRMGSFGFDNERIATMPGLNSKMSEITALSARLQLKQFETDVVRREELAAFYTSALESSFDLQRQTGLRQVRSFFPVLLPHELAPYRHRIIEEMRAAQVGVGTYFSPHAADHPFVRATSRSGPLPVTTDISSRILSLPLWTGMTREHAHAVVSSLVSAVERYSANAQQSVLRNEAQQQPGQEIAA